MIIRHAKISDLQGVKAIYEQQHAFESTLQLPYQADSLWENRFANFSENNISLVAVIDDEVVGQLSLFVCNRARRKHTANFGMGVSSIHKRQGIGFKLLSSALDMADNWLNITRVELEVYVDNEPAIKLYKKLGFVIEGTSKNYAFKSGQYVDAFFMARIKENKES